MGALLDACVARLLNVVDPALTAVGEFYCMQNALTPAMGLLLNTFSERLAPPPPMFNTTGPVLKAVGPCHCPVTKRVL